MVDDLLEVNIPHAIELVLQASTRGGWIVDRWYYTASGSYYIRVLHPKRKAVMIRVSDHNGTPRAGQKMIDVVSHRALRSARFFLIRSPRPVEHSKGHGHRFSRNARKLFKNRKNDAWDELE